MGIKPKQSHQTILVTLLGIEPRHYTGHEPAALPTEL